MKDYKFLIGSGCSYGKVANSLHHWKEHLNIDEDTIIIDLQKDSQSANYSADSIIYTCNTLIENGVDVNNIFVINEWTTYDRVHYTFPAGVVDVFDKEIRIENNIEVYNSKPDIVDKVKSLLNIYQYFDKNDDKYQIQKIEDLFYINPGHIDVQDYRDTSVYEWMVMYQKHSEGITNENLVINYLNNILKLQYYLKSKNIDYNFHFINSQFSGWKLNSFGNIFHHHIDKFMLTNGKLIDNRKYHDEYVKSLNSFSDIQNIFPGVKTKFNEIDFSKFWLYNKNGYRYGGVDEWTFDNFNGFGYTHSLLNYTPGDSWKYYLETYGNHPNHVVYFLISQELLRDCSFINFKPNVNEKLMSQVNFELETRTGELVSYDYENELFNSKEDIENVLGIKLVSSKETILPTDMRYDKNAKEIPITDNEKNVEQKILINFKKKLL